MDLGRVVGQLDYGEFVLSCRTHAVQMLAGRVLC